MRIGTGMKLAFLLGPLPLLCGCERSAEVESGNLAEPESTGLNSAAAELPAPRLAKSSADPARDEAELMRLEQDYARALMTKDRAFLMRFYAPDWRGGNWMGFWSKSTMLKSVLNARYVVKSMRLRDLKVRLLGDIALVQGVDEEVTSVDGKDTSGKWSFTDVFERRDGRWMAVASHTSEVKPTGE